MQGAAEALRENLWGKLRTIYNNFSKGSEEIKIQAVEQFVVDVLKEDNQNELDYVMKNIFRLDADGSGTVSFLELGNFLFKRHCGQLSLQREHRSNKMSRGKDRLMNLDEFIKLLNNSYKFLEVVCPPDVAKFVFDSVDADHDGWITYVEYFKVIEIYVCKGGKVQAPVPPPAPVGPERRSRLRIYLWNLLRQLYDAHVQGRSLASNDEEVKRLIFAIVGQLSQAELSFLSNGLLQLDYKVITFEPFATHFFNLIAELGLSRYSRNNSCTKKTLNRDEFILVLTNTFTFGKLSKFSKNILYKIFDKIDKNHDGLISFQEYLDWVKRFLSVLKYFGDEFYVPEDDYDLDNSDPLDREVIPPSIVDKSKVEFVFSDYSLAKQVRARVYELLIPFDYDKNNEFNEKEITAALVGLFKEDENELKYMVKNVFRYDKDNNNEVTYDELTNFCVEQHFGEMAIQRLHRKNYYSKGAERVMNQEEFGNTLNYVLERINLKASPQIINLLFSEIDLDHDGWITYIYYFLFLKYYFGSNSLCATTKPTEAVLSEYDRFLKGYDGLSPWDRFVRIIVDQLRLIFFRYDYNKNQVFELEEIQDILSKVFGFTEEELNYIMFNYFNFLKSQNDNVTFEQLIAIILSIYFLEILFHRRYKSTDGAAWKERKISLEEFINLITEACYFIKFKPFKDDLVFIFRQLDTDKDGYITFKQYSDFIRKYLGNGIDFNEKPAPVAAISPEGVSEEQYAFVNAIWDELRAYFNKYDKGPKGFLNEAELRLFVIEVLNETTERELNYVFWNLFRVDSNSNKQVDFQEFAPFILNHAGEISLQKFHREQTKGKNSLSDEELYVVFTNGFKFLSSMPKQRQAISSIFKRIGTNGAVSYSVFLNWIHHALAARYKKK